MDAVQNRTQAPSTVDTRNTANSTAAATQSATASPSATSSVMETRSALMSRSVTAANKSSFDSIRAELEESAKAANDRLAVYNQKLDIAIDGVTGAIVVKVSDADTGEILRQIPSEDALRIMRNIDSLTGILVDHKE